MHDITSRGVMKGYLSRAEHQALCGLFCAVQPIAQDRAVESVRMRAMDAELVGAAGLGKEIDMASAVFLCAAHAVVCHGGFAMLEVNHLSGTVERIGE